MVKTNGETAKPFTGKYVDNLKSNPIDSPPPQVKMKNKFLLQWMDEKD